MNVLEQLNAHISRALIAKASNFLGESEDNTARGFHHAMPAILAAILNSIHDKEKLIRAWDLIQHKDNDVDLLNQLEPLFEGNSAASSNTSIGAELLNDLFGGKATILNSIGSVAAFKKSNSAGKVVSIAAPLVLAFLRNKVEINELGMAGLLKWISDDKDAIVEALPSGWTSQMGMTHLMFKKEKLETESEEQINSNPNWWLWLVGLVVLIACLLFFVKSCSQKEVADKTSGAYRTVKEIVEAVQEETEDAAFYMDETLDAAGQAFKLTWKALGKYVTIKLEDSFLGLPKKGMELRLLGWLQDPATVVEDNKAWFNFDRILFDTDSIKLNKVSDEQLKALAAIMNVMPKVEFEIGGYTDNTGDAAANKKLSLERAKAVKKVLVDFGIDEKRLKAVGYGADNPIADNNDPAGRERNRRVAIRVTKK
jgi:outer membrane protein OmpA-like peptidoglycan-associated protein